MDQLFNVKDEQKEELLGIINKYQMQDQQRMYNNLSSRCFTHCVTNFRSRELAESEKKCVLNCAEKYMKLQQRVGIRFQEENAKLEAGMKSGGSP